MTNDHYYTIAHGSALGGVVCEGHYVVVNLTPIDNYSPYYISNTTYVMKEHCKLLELQGYDQNDINLGAVPTDDIILTNLVLHQQHLAL